MTELLTKAFEAAARLPLNVQDEVAQRLLEDLRQYVCSSKDSNTAVEPRPALKALVGLIETPIDVDGYLETSRGPSWDPEFDSEA